MRFRQRARLASLGFLAAGPNHSVLTAGAGPRKGVTTGTAKEGDPTKRRRRSSAGPRALNEPPALAQRRESRAAEATLWTPRVVASADAPRFRPSGSESR